MNYLFLSAPASTANDYQVVTTHLVPLATEDRVLAWKYYHEFGIRDFTPMFCVVFVCSSSGLQLLCNFVAVVV
jgi:hypothetical protein